MKSKYQKTEAGPSAVPFTDSEPAASPGVSQSLSTKMPGYEHDIMPHNIDTTTGGLNTASPALETPDNATVDGAKPPLAQAWPKGASLTLIDSTTTQHSDNDNQLKQSALSARPVTKKLRVFLQDLYFLVGAHSSYNDFISTIPDILHTVGTIGDIFGRDELGHFYCSLNLAFNIVRSEGGFNGLIAGIAIEEAIEGMHSEASLKHQILCCCSVIPTSGNWTNTRELHRFLGVKQPFSLWITQRINELRMVENRDYSRVICHVRDSRKSTLLPRHRWEISVPAEVATEMAMMESSPRGRRVHRYFINQAKMLEPDSLKSWEQFVAAMKDNSKKSTATPS